MINKDYVTHEVEFTDNAEFAAICGPLDRHLSQLEHALNISISRSGNRLLVQGDEKAAAHGREIAEHLKDRHVQRGQIDEEDVKGAIRFAGYEIGYHPAKETVTTSTHEGLRTPRKNVLARSPNQALMIEVLKTQPLTFGLGPAGTGKTYLAVAAAVEALAAGRVERIILSRPAVEAGERIGFLPGDMKEKVDPYMQPLYDALGDCLPPKQLARMYEDKTIEIAPLAFMRGRTLGRAFIVLDEAQNATIAQMKMFLTRLGSDAQMAITGDESQVDLPQPGQSGLLDAVKRLAHLREVRAVHFTEEDVVRHPLVAAIIRAYNQ